MGAGRIIRVVAGAALATGALGVAIPGSAGAPAVGPWHPTGPMASGRYRPPAATLANGRVLVLGGDEKSEPLTSQIYDPASRTWSAGPALARQSLRWTVVALSDGGALLIGAAECTKRARFIPFCLPTHDVYRLTADDGSWARAAPMLEARAGPLAVEMRDGRVLVAGGFGDGCTGPGLSYSCRSIYTAEVYDPRRDRWSQTGPMPFPRGGAVGTLMSDGTVLAVGGANPVRNALRYDPRTGIWTTLRPSAFTHTGATLLALPGNRAVVFGEDGSAGSYQFGVIRPQRRFAECGVSPEVYAASTNTWKSVPPFPDGSFACSTVAARVAGGMVLFERGSGLYVLDRNLLCWSSVPEPSLEFGELLGLGDGSALYFAGQSPDRPPFSGAETLVPSQVRCPATARIRDEIFTQLQPSGRGASLGRVLESGYRMRLTLPAAGSVVVRWYARAPARRRPHHAPPLLAVGHATARRAGPVSLTLRLTELGRSSFQADPFERLQARAVYEAAHMTPVSVLRSFTLGD